MKLRNIKFFRVFKDFLFFSILFFVILTSCISVGQNKNVTLNQTSTAKVEQKVRVGFDVDDTLLFSTPNFDNAFNSGIEPYSREFWEMVNKNDEKYSKVKQKTKQILEQHLKNGDEVYIITARKPYGGEYLKKYLSKTFGVPEKNIFFEPELKSDRISSLGLTIFYGDSDNDIRDALKGGARPIRILRAKESSYKKNYNVGNYNEEVVENSEW